jgi:hypothetical protein
MVPITLKENYQQFLFIEHKFNCRNVSFGVTIKVKGGRPLRESDADDTPLNDSKYSTRVSKKQAQKDVYKI